MWYVWSDGLRLEEANRLFNHYAKSYKNYEFKVVPSEWYSEPEAPHITNIKFYQVEGRKVENQSQK